MKYSGELDSSYSEGSNFENSSEDEIDAYKSRINKKRDEKSRKIQKINKVYDSLDDEEQQEILNAYENYFIIELDSFYYFIWKTLMFILLLYSFIAIPIILAFDESIELINVFMKIELGIEIIYLIDILIS